MSLELSNDHMDLVQKEQKVARTLELTPHKLELLRHKELVLVALVHHMGKEHHRLVGHMLVDHKDQELEEQAHHKEQELVLVHHMGKVLELELVRRMGKVLEHHMEQELGQEHHMGMAHHKVKEQVDRMALELVDHMGMVQVVDRMEMELGLELDHDRVGLERDDGDDHDHEVHGVAFCG